MFGHAILGEKAM